MENKYCPSYDCGFCETYPAPYSVKCGDDETKTCCWLKFDFKKTTYEEFEKHFTKTIIKGFRKAKKEGRIIEFKKSEKGKK